MSRTFIVANIDGVVRPLSGAAALFPDSATVHVYDLGDTSIRVSLRLARLDDRPALVGVAVEPNGAPRELTATELRALPIDELVEEAVRAVAMAAADSATRPWYRPDVQGAGEGAVQARRRRAITPALLDQVARVYAANPDAPVQAVAETLYCSPRTAARWVAKARERGLVPPTNRTGPAPRGTD